MSDQAVKVKGVADVVFLVDCTGSMEPCLDVLKSSFAKLASSLSGGNYGNVDWRAKVIGYRDLAVDRIPLIGDKNPFVDETNGLQAQIDPLYHEGGGDEPESALDAILFAIKMPDWRPIGEAHRVIVLLTDATTHPETQDGNSVMDVATGVSSGHFKLLVYGPACKEYEILGKIPKSSYTDVSQSGNVYEGLKNLNWSDFFETIAKTVSQQVAPVTAAPSQGVLEEEPDDSAPIPPPDVLNEPTTGTLTMPLPSEE